MKVTINGHYVIVGVTQSSGQIVGFLFREGKVYEIIKKVKCHNRKPYQLTVDMINSLECYNGIFYSGSCDFTLSKFFIK